MAVLSTSPTLTPPAVPDPVAMAASAVDQLMDGIAAAAKQSTDAEDTVDDAVVQIVLVILDAATTLATNAANATQAAATLNDDAAKKRADCARGWSVVAAVIAVVVTVVAVVLAVIAGIFSMASGGGALAAISAACAIIFATITVIQNTAASTIQIILVASVRVIGALVTATETDRTRLRRDTAVNLQRAMTMVQTESAKQLPSLVLNLDQSIAASDAMSSALQKLLALLQQWQSDPLIAIVTPRVARLNQAHALLLARLRNAKLVVPFPVPGVSTLGGITTTR